MIIFYFLLGTAIRVIVNLKVNQVACGSLASTVSDSESENFNDAFFWTASWFVLIDDRLHN